MVKKNKEISFDESGDYSTEAQEQFQKNVDAFEQAKWCQPFQPLKVPAVHEPEIPSGSGWLVGVIGLLAIGKPLTDGWVFRSEVFARITGLAPGAAATEAAVAAALAHERGVLKGAPADCRRLAFLNQADAPGRRAAGLRIADLLVRMDGVAIRRTVVGHVRKDPPVTAVFERS